MVLLDISLRGFRDALSVGTSSLLKITTKDPDVAGLGDQLKLIPIWSNRKAEHICLGTEDSIHLRLFSGKAAEDFSLSAGNGDKIGP